MKNFFCSLTLDIIEVLILNFATKNFGIHFYPIIPSTFLLPFESFWVINKKTSTFLKESETIFCILKILLQIIATSLSYQPFFLNPCILEKKMQFHLLNYSTSALFYSTSALLSFPSALANLLTISFYPIIRISFGISAPFHISYLPYCFGAIKFFVYIKR